MCASYNLALALYCTLTCPLSLYFIFILYHYIIVNKLINELANHRPMRSTNYG